MQRAGSEPHLLMAEAEGLFAPVPVQFKDANQVSNGSDNGQAKNTVQKLSGIQVPQWALLQVLVFHHQNVLHHSENYQGIRKTINKKYRIIFVVQKTKHENDSPEAMFLKVGIEIS